MLNNDNTLQANYEKLIEHYGDKHQAYKTVEELNELGAALMQLLGGRLDKMTAVIDEIADVYNMLEQVLIIFEIDKNLIHSRMLSKLSVAVSNIPMAVGK